MNELEKAEFEVVVLCDETAGQCRCIKPVGHVEEGDPRHRCDPNYCTGEWSGNFNAVDGTLVVHTFPSPVVT